MSTPPLEQPLAAATTSDGWPSEQPEQEEAPTEAVPVQVRGLAERAQDMREALADWLKREHDGQSVEGEDFSARVRELAAAWVPLDRDALRGILRSQPEIMEVSEQDIARLASKAAHDEGPRQFLTWLCDRLAVPRAAGYQRLDEKLVPSSGLLAALAASGLKWQEAFNETPDAVTGALDLEGDDANELALAMARRLAVRQLARELGPVDQLRIEHNQEVERLSRLTRFQESEQAVSDLGLGFDYDSIPGAPDLPGFEGYEEPAPRRPQVVTALAEEPGIRPLSEPLPPRRQPPDMAPPGPNH